MTKTTALTTTPPPTETTPWQVLSGIDVSLKIEKKNGLSYLSWAWAWAELKKAYPYAWFRKHENGAGFPCFHDVQGYAFVKVTVGLDRTGDHEVTELLPVLDHRNKPIQGPNAFEVNNALQRCLTKAIAYHGLGHYIYAGEDLPETASSASSVGVTAPVGGVGVSTPTPALAAPTEAPPFNPDTAAPTVMYPTGDGYVQNRSPEIIAATFLTFIPLCTTDQLLTTFYATNKSARDYLQAQDPERHMQVLAAFSDAKRKFVKPNPAEGES